MKYCSFTRLHTLLKQIHVTSLVTDLEHEIKLYYQTDVRSETSTKITEYTESGKAHNSRAGNSCVLFTN